MLLEIFSYVAGNSVTYKRAKVACDHCGATSTRIPAAAVRSSLHYCNSSCSDVSKAKRKKTLATNIARYGVAAPAMLVDIKQKTMSTNMERYGVPWSAGATEVRQTIEATNMARYGVNNAAKVPEVIARMRETTLIRHGVEWPCLLQTTQDASHQPEATLKMMRTRVSNGSMNSSSQERRVFNALKNRFLMELHPFVNRWSIDMSFVSDGGQLVYVQVDGEWCHGLDMPVETVMQRTSDHGIRVARKYLRDREQDAWFAQNCITLVRVTDVETDACVSDDELIELVVNRSAPPESDPA